MNTFAKAALPPAENRRVTPWRRQWLLGFANCCYVLFLSKRLGNCPCANACAVIKQAGCRHGAIWWVWNFRLVRGPVFPWEDTKFVWDSDVPFSAIYQMGNLLMYACLWNGPQKASTLFRAPIGRESTGTQHIQDPVYDACSFCGTGKYLCGVVVSIPFLYDESRPEGIVQDWSHCF